MSANDDVSFDVYAGCGGCCIRWKAISVLSEQRSVNRCRPADETDPLWCWCIVLIPPQTQ